MDAPLELQGEALQPDALAIQLPSSSQARYERYKGILKDLTIMSDKLCDLYCKNAEDMHSKILAEMD